MKRLALFSFYNKSGRVNSSVLYYLDALSKIADTVFIVNGSLLPQSESKLEAEGYEIYKRENKGFDFGAWKDFILSKDSSFFSQYDELILCNSSCYGPVYPFSGLFDEMDGRGCDFWGLYRHPGLRDGKLCIPPHIQSYFLVLRKRMFRDPCLREYFSGLGYAASWDDAVKAETSFTSYFEERGFVSSSYSGSVFSKFIENPTIFMPAELLRKKFPLIKRKCFTTDYGYINKISSAVQIHELLEYLSKFTDYPVDLICEDLLESQQNSHLIKVLGLDYVIESDREYAQSPQGSCSTAAVIYSSKPENIDLHISYLNNLPAGSSVFIVVSSEKLKDGWQSRLADLSNFRTEIRLTEGAAAGSACSLSCRDMIASFDFVCLLRDYDGATSNPPVKDRFFQEHCLSGLLYSREYVRNILGLFRNNGRLGLLMPFVPMFAEWPKRILNEEWGGSLENAKKLYSLLQLSVPFDDHPVAPWGGMFWFRGKAIAPLCSHGWSEKDFLDHGMDCKGDGAGEALLRMYPMIAQESGFLSGCIIPSALAGHQYANLCCNLEKYSTVKIDSGHVHFSEVKKVLGLYLKRKFRKIFGGRK